MIFGCKFYNSIYSFVNFFNCFIWCERIEFESAEVLANADYCKAGYGVLTEAEREAVNLFAKHEGLLLDPVYTGRAAAGMIDLIRKGYFKSEETVLFWHTGGQPALFAEKYANILKT